MSGSSVLITTVPYGIVVAVIDAPAKGLLLKIRKWVKDVGGMVFLVAVAATVVVGRLGDRFGGPLPEDAVIFENRDRGWLPVSIHKLGKHFCDGHGCIPSCLPRLVGDLEGIIDAGV